MNIERKGGWFVINRGSDDKPSYLSFFVDHDRSAWSKWFTQSKRHISVEAAEETLKELKRRARERRQSRKKVRPSS